MYTIDVHSRNYTSLYIVERNQRVRRVCRRTNKDLIIKLNLTPFSCNLVIVSHSCMIFLLVAYLVKILSGGWVEHVERNLNASGNLIFHSKRD